VTVQVWECLSIQVTPGTPIAACAAAVAVGAQGLDVPGRMLTLAVSEEELLRRRPNAATLAGSANPARGWERLYIDHVQQADTVADLDFLVGASGDHVSRESH
jgi:dihydroxyacid dehydratase/phosphogluconate dehydratase